MYRTKMSVALLLAVSALAAVYCNPVTIQQPCSSTSSDNDMLTLMSQMTGGLLAQNKDILNGQETSGPFEMHISGFSAVVKTTGKQDKIEITKNDAPSAPALVSKPTFEGYKRHGDGIYKYHRDGADWETARATCEREGAHLAIPNSDEEAQFLVDLFNWERRHYTAKNVSLVYKNEIWVGASDIAEEGHFVTVLGDELSSTGFDKWLENQPDDWKVVNPSGEDCVCLQEEKALYDLHCSVNLPFTCEADSAEKEDAPEMPDLKSYVTPDIPEPLRNYYRRRSWIRW